MTSSITAHTTSHPDEPRRSPSTVDAFADRYLEECVTLDPDLRIQLGLPGATDEPTDISPEGISARAEHTRQTLAALESLVADPATQLDATDETTVAALRDRLGLQVAIHDAGLDVGELNVLASPIQGTQEVFDLMPTDTADQWAAIASRLGRTGDVLAQYRASLDAAIAAGRPPARRQVEACLGQIDGFVTDDGPFAMLASRARPDGGEPSAALAADLATGVAAARDAYAELARHLREQVLPVARENDAAGREEYALLSRHHVGATLDLDEAYVWGLEEVARLEAEMSATARRISPGASTREAIALLEADPSRQVVGKDALRAWMQQLSDSAVEALAGSHFDIPEPVRRLECRIAPSSSGVIYYTPPSEDFSRPGRMWWSVPPGVERFSTWRERTTVFHEGVPGHHLQIGQTLYRSAILNRWRRTMCFTSGHAEGWALYAERLMSDLGWLDDPADHLGMLDGSLFRATRVVVDIGLHLGLEAPAELGGGRWDADKVWTFLRAHTFQAEEFLRFEHLRYLGWPGQAPAYKLGERVWLQLRTEAQQRAAAAGEPFDLAAWHRRALDVGSVPLDVLRQALSA
ncbi:Uncharacterized conserved protein, DUF885 familyt [Quadrisphaera granulorum]|uniref:Uncharacterized protein (DUF885 family) n=1 Tax=Quadrisphaera granulorum TaxID=317664 RepID=A0A316A725_9ACTN|nr:DUF885 domain-containing protein [Quadrisphaera granulorum]PWJ52780.1 uncharacterized protein (DUF885 family) [Quadrisphaera granulorum]SZE97385.1 Uncharacterized conserved protein, DUF885 familyt [Quadrisphaera granulorum]